MRLLDAVYLTDSATQAYCAFRDFVEYKRSSGETFAVFIVEFEKRYKNVEKHDMKLPTGAKAYFLLQAANLIIDNERLARATAKLDHEDMKNQIQKVFADTAGSAGKTLPVKAEEFNYTSERGRGGMRSRGRPSQRNEDFYIRRDESFNRRNEIKGDNQVAPNVRQKLRFNNTNPIGVDGARLKCPIYQSIKHFAARCPHRKSREEAQMGKEKGDAEQCYLMSESVGYGVLDTACTKTVAGTE